MSTTRDATGRDRPSLDRESGIETCYASGLAALAAGQLAGARQWAARCAEAIGGEGDPRCAALSGRIALEDGEIDTAIGHLRRAQTRAPEESLITRWLAEALAAAGATRDARDVLEGAVRGAASDPDVLVDLSYLRLLDGDRPGAREAIARAAALRPDDEQILLAQARLYEALGEPDRAVAPARRVAASTTSGAVLGDLLRLFLAADRFVEAELAFRRLQAIDPDHFVFAQHGRIWCRIKAGDWRSALELAIGATHADRYELTTALLAYARDRLFTRVPVEEAIARETALHERMTVAVRAYLERHQHDPGEPLRRPEDDAAAVTAGVGH